MLRANSCRQRMPRQEERRSRWMGSEEAFLKARAVILLPVMRASVRRSGVAAVPSVDTEQLLMACRKSGLKSKG